MSCPTRRPVTGSSISTSRSSASAKQARAHLPTDTARCAILGEDNAAARRCGAEQSVRRAELPALPSRLQDRLRTGDDARRQQARRARASRGGSRVPRRRIRVRHQHGLSRRRARNRERTAVQQHRRAEPARRGAALHRSEPRAAGARAFVPDRRRRELPRLRERHHAHLCRQRRRRVPGADRRGRRGAARLRRRRCAPDSRIRNCTCMRITCSPASCASRISSA